MMSLGELLSIVISIMVPAAVIIYIASRFFALREKRLEIEAGLAAEKAAQYAARTQELEQRVRVIEQIVTDRGVETAGQIEALRRQKRIESGEIVR